MSEQPDLRLNEQILSRLDDMNTHLSNIHQHMLWVFWLVAVFALLYFGLLIYLMM